MDSMFLVNDDIDLSDDDFEIDFSRGKSQFNSTSQDEDIPDTVPVAQNQTNMALSHMVDGNSTVGNANNRFDPKDRTSKLTEFHGVGDTKSRSYDIFDSFVNDDTDELMSQIDMPLDKKRDSVDLQHKDNAIKQYSGLEKNISKVNKNEYCQANKLFSRDIISNERRESGHSSKQQSKNVVKSPCGIMTTDLPIPFHNKTSNNDTFTPAFRSVRSCDDKTPIKMTSCPPERPHRDVTPIKIPTCQSTSPDVTVRSGKRKVCASHENSSHKQRRFPGPAGILPSINNFPSLEKLKSPETGKGKRTLTPLTPKTPIECIISSSQDDDFTQNLWSDVQKQVCRLFPHRTCETISKILQEATQNQINNRKVALLCGLIKSFSISGSGGKLVLKDPSGEINGTVHKNVLDEYEPDLCQGTGLILKDISVFSPSVRKHYVNITPSNIVQIFPAEIIDVTSTQSQSTQLPRSSKGKENVAVNDIVERQNKFIGNIISNDSSTGLNDKSSDIFGNDDSDDNFFRDELCFLGT